MQDLQKYHILVASILKEQENFKRCFSASRPLNSRREKYEIEQNMKLSDTGRQWEC